MPTVKINSKINLGLDEILQGIGSLETVDLERFMAQISNLIARRKAPNLSKKEAELLLKINQGVSEKDSKKYEELGAKLQAETITPEEQKVFSELVTKIEIADAKRIEYLAELAVLREISLDALMEQLSLYPPKFS